MVNVLTQQQEQAILAQVEQATMIFREGMLHLLVSRTRDYTQEEGEQFDAEAQALAGHVKEIIEARYATHGQLRLAVPVAATSRVTLTLMAYVIAQCREAGGLPEEVHGLRVRTIREQAEDEA
jgi:hypothetical protein